MADLSPGVPNALKPLVRRIVAPDGTNTYLVGVDEIAVVDPGPDDPGHVDAIVGCGGDRIRWVLVTSCEHGHAAGAAAVKARTGAEVLGFGPADCFLPDHKVGDGYQLEATEFRLLVMHMPGFAPDHLCYLIEDDRILLSGDLLRGPDEEIDPGSQAEAASMGEAASAPMAAVADPAAYQAAIQRLAKLRPPLRGIAPGHGHFIDDAKSALAQGLRAA